jgi:hypothetical protein
MIAIAVTVVILAAIGSWFYVANRRWIAMLRDSDHRLASDPFRDPGQWAKTAQWRVGELLNRLGTEDPNPQVEFWRVRTRNRFILWVTIGLPVFLLGTLVVESLRAFVLKSVQRYSDGFGLALVAVGFAMFLYYAAYLGRVLIRYGNGENVRLRQVLFPLAGLVASLVFMAIMPTLDLRKG